MPPPVLCVLRDSHVDTCQRATERRWQRHPNAVGCDEQHRTLSTHVERPDIVSRTRIPEASRVGHGVRRLPVPDDAEDDPVLRGVRVGNRHRKRVGAVDEALVDHPPADHRVAVRQRIANSVQPLVSSSVPSRGFHASRSR